MTQKLKHINRKGTPYYFREVAGTRGVQIVCSQTESENDLAAIPDTHEIAESPNGQVSCRKKIKCDLLAGEIKLAQGLCPNLVKQGIRIIVEVKKKSLVIHSADTESINEMAKFVMSISPDRGDIEAILGNNLRYEPVLKLELTDKGIRTFAASRMCWVGENDWLFLDEGALKELLKKYAPHIGQESFYDLF